MQATFDPALLHEAGADIVIFHKRRAQEIDLYESIQAQITTQLGTAQYEDERIAIYEVSQTDNPVDTLITLPTTGTTEDVVDYPMFVPEAGWVDIEGMLQADGREVVLCLDGISVHRWNVENPTEVRTPVYIPARSYTSFRIALEPPCPTHYDPSLSCRVLTYDIHAKFVPG